MIDLKQLVSYRDEALLEHRDWKRRSWSTDLIIANKWSVVWDDLSVQAEEPLVENLFLEALEDKSATAASIVPRILVGPSRGTRNDEAEEMAQKKRRAFVTILQQSNYEAELIRWYMDWWQHGAMYSVPWCDFTAPVREPYLIRLDPRQAFPLSHSSTGELTGVMFCRLRRLVDLQNEWGRDHEAIIGIQRARDGKKIKPSTPIEEVWFYDTDQWAVAIYDDQIPEFASQYRYVSPLRQGQLTTSARVEWLLEPAAHGMNGCPVVEGKRHAGDSEYRGGLDIALPNLRVAQNLMARMLDDIELNIYAPVIFEGILNPEDYGPGAKLLGDGNGKARVEYARPPMAFDAHQHIQLQLESTRNAMKYPQQRGGEFGASIASAKGVDAVMGAFSSETAWSQRDSSLFLQRSLGRAANFDELWCPGSKKIDGFDEGEFFSDKYNPRTLWKGDYRVYVTFAGGLGMDQQGYLLTLATAKNMGALASRTFMQKSGLIENPLAEEREMALEAISQAFLAFSFKQADQGNVQPLLDIAYEIDDDSKSARSAIMDVIKKTQQALPAQGGGMPGGGGPMDMVEMARSMASGGVPGMAEGQPPMTPDVQGLLPPQLASIGSEMMPGGTAA